MKIDAVTIGSVAVGVIGLGALFLSRKASAGQLPVASLPGAGGQGEVRIDESAGGGFVADSSFLNSVNDVMASVGLSEPRGVRNNNPLNMVWSASNNWNGQVGKDSAGYCIFDTPLSGIRAAAVNLRSYGKAGLKSIRQIVTKWTSGDSVTVQNNYISYVSKRLGIAPDVALNTNNWAALLQAMAYFENGKEVYTFDLFAQGVNAAGV